MTESRKQYLIKQAWNLLDTMENSGASASEIAEQRADIMELENLESRPDAGRYGFHN